jgi:hypothetical protein
MAGVGSFRFAFGHFDAANASGIVHSEVDRAVVTKPFQDTLTKADRLPVVAYVSPAPVPVAAISPVAISPAPVSPSPVSPVPDDTELAKANEAAVELLSRISPAIVAPEIVSRHWQESVPPVALQKRTHKAKLKPVKLKQAKAEPISIKPPLPLDPKACQLEEFDAFRWAFSMPTGCHL